MNDNIKNKREMMNSFIIRNKKYTPKQIKTYNYINTNSGIFKDIDLTPLEERMGKLSLKKLISMNNSKNNSYNKKNINDITTPKALRKDQRAKLFYERNNILNKNITPNIFSYTTRNINKRKNNNSYINLNITVEEKAKLIENDKILKIKEKIDKKNMEIQNFLTQKKLFKKKLKENEEIKNEKKDLKIKMYKLINKNGKICQNFIKKNDNYNIRFINYYNSNDFIKSKRLFNDNFHFSKNELSKAHDPFKQYLETDSISKNSINIKNLFNSLSNKDKKIIQKEPNYFFRNNTVFENFNDIEKKPLVTTLIEEEEIQNMIKNKIPKKEIENYKEKKDIINQRIIEYANKNKNELDINEKDNKNIYEYNNNVSQLINKDTIKNIKNDFILRLKTRKKNNNAIINKELKKCERNMDNKDKDKFIDNKKFNNTFNKKINYLTKIEILNNNSKRLYKEEDFQIKRNIIKTEGKGEKYLNDLKNKIINEYISKYKKDNKD